MDRPEYRNAPLVTRAEVRLYLVALAVFVIGMAVAL